MVQLHAVLRRRSVNAQIWDVLLALSFRYKELHPTPHCCTPYLHSPTSATCLFHFLLLDSWLFTPYTNMIVHAFWLLHVELSCVYTIASLLAFPVLKNWSHQINKSNLQSDCVMCFTSARAALTFTHHHTPIMQSLTSRYCKRQETGIVWVA